MGQLGCLSLISMSTLIVHVGIVRGDALQDLLRARPSVNQPLLVGNPARSPCLPGVNCQPSRPLSLSPVTTRPIAQFGVMPLLRARVPRLTAAAGPLRISLPVASPSHQVPLTTVTNVLDSDCLADDTCQWDPRCTDDPPCVRGTDHPCVTDRETILYCNQYITGTPGRRLFPPDNDAHTETMKAPRRGAWDRARALWRELMSSLQSARHLIYGLGGGRASRSAQACCSPSLHARS